MKTVLALLIAGLAPGLALAAQTQATQIQAAQTRAAQTRAAQTRAAQKRRTFRVAYRTTVRELPAGARTLEVWLPVPQTDAHQTIHEVSIEGPGPFTLGREPRYGNQAAYFRVTVPRAPLHLKVTVTATRRESTGIPEQLSREEAGPYLAAEPLVPTDGPVAALAREAVRGKRTYAEKARAIYEKVTGLLKYDKSGTGWGRGDAIWACDARRGNCTDFHALIIGMARSQGIPARFAIGLPLPEARGRGEIPGYHCWAELHVDGRWVPVDSSEAARGLAQGRPEKLKYFYGHHDENRLELSRGRHLRLQPQQQGEPLNFFVYPYAEVDGRKHEAVTRAFTYQDLPERPERPERR